MKTFLRAFFLLIILLISGVTFLLTPTGLRWSIDFSKNFLPGKLQIQKISGVIVGPITLENLRYEDNDATIALKKIRIDWNPLELIHHKLHITALNATQLQVSIKEDTAHPHWTPEKIKAMINAWSTRLSQQTNLRILVDHAALDHFTLITNKNPKDNFYFEKLFFRGLLRKNAVDVTLSGNLTKPVLLNFSFTLSGTPNNYYISSLLKGKNTHFEITGEGNKNAFSLQTKQIQFLNGSLAFNYAMQLSPFVTWTGKIRANHINPSLLNSEWTNRLSMTINSSGNEKSELITHSDATITTPQSTLHLLIDYEKKLKIHWELKTNALARWADVLTGNLRSHGHIEGDLDNPSFRMTLNTHFKTENAVLKRATITAEGDFKHHTLTFDAASPGQSIKLSIDGHYQDEKWQGELRKFTMMLLRNTHWHLEKRVPISASDQKITLGNLCLRSGKAGAICLQGEWSPKKILGQLQIHLSHFGWLRSFLPTLHIAAGTANANLTLAGTLKKPIINGTVNFPGARFIFPRLKVSLDRLKATFTSNGYKLLIDLQAFSAKTPLNLKGSVDLSQPTLTAEATLVANNLLVMNTPEYIVYASTQLKATVQGDKIVLSGNITIPKATIHPDDFKTTVTLPDHDIVFVGGFTPPPKPYWNLQNNMTITLGKAVKIDASGITAQLGGSITLKQPKPNEAIFGNGEIFIRNGEYSVYGQTLKISSDSSLIFSDSLLNNPGLSLKASKKIQSIENMGNGTPNFTRNFLVVGIEITGTVKSPKISFFSNRSSLSEADILSYILLGYANTSNTPGNTDFLLRALAAVNISSQGLMGKQNIATQIQRGLGLNEMGVESETTTDALGNPLNQQSAFVVGKNLSRHFYVRYSVGILDPINVFELRYFLNDNWALQLSSSTLGNGGDVLYSIQKN
ncbi:MAG: translocation/assembly module TamB domain-containing protein [Coxiellaceae bacterium]|nr:translocation/assembly module TamB domain-containing protein [Coxiellaceae bacterium]